MLLVFGFFMAILIAIPVTLIVLVVKLYKSRQRQKREDREYDISRAVKEYHQQDGKIRDK